MYFKKKKKKKEIKIIVKYLSMIPLSLFTNPVISGWQGSLEAYCTCSTGRGHACISSVSGLISSPEPVMMCSGELLW